MIEDGDSIVHLSRGLLPKLEAVYVQSAELGPFECEISEYDMALEDVFKVNN